MIPQTDVYDATSRALHTDVEAFMAAEGVQPIPDDTPLLPKKSRDAPEAIWARVGIEWLENDQVTLGRRARFRLLGRLVLGLHISLDGGIGPLERLADKILVHYRGNTLPPAVFADVTVTNIFQDGPWWRVTVAASFRVDNQR